MADYNPSTCDITKCVITSYDGSTDVDLTTNFVSKFEINQSMGALAYDGNISVLDTAGILEGFPLRAEEYMELWIKSYDTGLEVKLKTRIHKITDIEPSPSVNGITYKIHFVSETTFEAGKRKITEPYQMSVAGMAYEVFKRHFGKISGEGTQQDPYINNRILPLQTKAWNIESEVYKRYLYIQRTVGATKVIIPDLSPQDSMFFIAARAYNPQSPSQTFRFFETLENYYFCTDEFFLKGLRDSDVEPLFFSPVAENLPDVPESQLQRVEEMRVLNKGIDSSTDIHSGAYRNEVVELDFIRRIHSINRFNFDDAKYVDMSGQPKNLDSNPHTEQFRKDTFTKDNARRFMIFRNYARNGDLTSNLSADKHFTDIVQNRVSYFHHLNNTAVACAMKGRLDLRPGMVVNLDVKKLQATNESNSLVNESLSGRYLIQSTNHTRDNAGTLNTSLTLVKFDWSAPQGERRPVTDETQVISA